MVLFPFLDLENLKRDVSEAIEEHPDLFHQNSNLVNLKEFHWLDFSNLTAENPIFTRNRCAQSSPTSLFTIISSFDLKSQTAAEIRRILGVN